MTEIGRSYNVSHSTMEGEVLLCLYGWVGYLRRTARALMTRAGIAPDHAERALGHVIGGVRGV
jgi:hypothetical protein